MANRNILGINRAKSPGNGIEWDKRMATDAGKNTLSVYATGTENVRLRKGNKWPCTQTTIFDDRLSSDDVYVTT